MIEPDPGTPGQVVLNKSNKLKELKMLRSLTLTAITFLLLCVGCSDTTQQNDEQEIIALERHALDKWSQGDTRGYLDIAADEVTWFDFTPGAQLRIEGIDAVRNFLEPLVGQIPPHTYDIVNPKFQIYDHTAVLTFHWKATTLDGIDLGGWKTTSVYHRANGKWQMVHANWSNVIAE